MDNNGWIKLYRELIDKPIWVNSTVEQRIIFITLLFMANHEPKKWEWQGKPYEMQSGQLITSVKSIVEKCKSKEITVQKVRTALERFEKMEFITIKSTKQNTLITILNWEKYQGRNIENNKQTNKQLTNTQPTANKQLTTNNNVKNIKNEKNEKNNIYAQNSDELFNRFWEAYPKKVGKSIACRSWEKLKVSNELFKTIMEKLEAYKHTKNWKSENGQYIPYPATWLNQRRWEDEIEMPCKNSECRGVVL